MRLPLRVLVGTALLLISGLPSASLASSRDQGVIWRAQAVRYPVALSALTPEPPYVPRAVPVQSGFIEVGPERAAAFWLDAAEIVRVRIADDGRSAALRFGRVVGSLDSDELAGAAPGQRSRAVVQEQGIAMADQIMYLLQPPPTGDLWFVDATVPTRVVIERPATRQGRLIWEVVHDDVLAWIDNGGPMPALPVVPEGTAVELRLRVDAAIAEAVQATYPNLPALTRALALWRKASGLAALATIRPTLGPYITRVPAEEALDDLELVPLLRGEQSSEEAGERAYRYLPAADKTWKLTLQGPGAVLIEARALIAQETSADRDLRIQLSAGGKVIAEISGPIPAARVGDDEPWQRALPDDEPLSAKGAPVSVLRQIRAELFPGEHTYQLTITGGPALVRITTMERRARLREVIERRAEVDDFVAKTTRELAALHTYDRGAAAFMDALIDELAAPTPARQPAARELPPLMQLIAMRSLARQRELAGDNVATLAAQVRDLIAAVPADAPPLLTWYLRVEFARGFLRWNAPEHAAWLLSPTHGDVPPAMWPLLGELMIEPERGPGAPSIALHAAAAAWRLDPVHPDSRRSYLRAWRRHTRWSQVTPTQKTQGSDSGSEGSRLPPTPWRWIGKGASARACTATLRYPASGLTYIPPGSTCQIDVQALPSAPERPAVVRIHVVTPGDSKEPVTVHLGDTKLYALMLQRLESIEIAVPPGQYPLRIDSAPEVMSFIGQVRDMRVPTVDNTPVRQRWPISIGSAPVRFPVPEAIGANPVRVELREVLASPAPGQKTRSKRDPMDLRLVTDTGWSTPIRFRPGGLDPDLLSLDAPGELSRPAAFTLWLPRDVREVWFEEVPHHPQAQGGAPRIIVAALAVRRAASALDVPLSESAPAAPLPASSDVLADSAIAARATAAGAPQPGAPQPSSAKPGNAASADDPSTACASDAVSPKPGAPAAPASLGMPLEPGASGASAESDLIAELYALSRCLLGTNRPPSLLLRRSELFLDLGRGDYARRDLDAIDPSALPVPLSALYAEVKARLDDWRHLAYLRPQPEPELFAKPTVLSPAWAALAKTPEDLAPWQTYVVTARMSGPEHASLASMDATDRADTGQPARALADYVRGRLHRMAGRHRDAALAFWRAYEGTRAWQLALAALEDLNHLLATAPTSPTSDAVAALAYGIAAELRGRIEHVEVRRALALAGERSQAEPVRGADSHAGFERLYVSAEEAEPSPYRELTWARLAPPWPLTAGHLIEPGKGARLRFDAVKPTAVWAELWCLPLDRKVDAGRPSTQGSAPLPSACTATVQADEAPRRRVTIPHGRVLALEPQTFARGAHELDIVLGDQDKEAVAAIRFLSNRPLGVDQASGQQTAGKEPTGKEPTQQAASRGSAVPVVKPVRAFLARPDRPLAFTVIGPTAVHIDARTTLSEPAAEIAVMATPESSTAVPAMPSGPAVIARRWRLDQAADDTVEGQPERGLTISRNVAGVLVLPERTRYRITLTPDRGVAMASAAVRRDIKANPPAPEPAIAPPAHQALGDHALLPLPLLGLPMPALTISNVYAGDNAEPTRSYSLAAEVGVGRDELDLSDPRDEGRSRLDLTLLWRRQVIDERLWLGSDLWLRQHFDSPTAIGVDLGLQARRLPLALRTRLRARLATQSLDRGRASSAALRAVLDRTFSLTSSLLLIPGAELRGAFYTIPPSPIVGIPAADFLDKDEVDPRVVTPFALDHDRAAIPRLSLFWLPFQDHVAVLTGEVVTNADLASIDHVALTGAWRGLAEVAPLRGPMYDLSYSIGPRFADAHRSEGYLGHRLGLDLTWALWRGTSGRLSLEVSERLYLGFGVHNIFRISLRFDFVSGRGIRDAFPTEIDFDDLEEPRLWSPLR